MLKKLKRFKIIHIVLFNSFKNAREPENAQRKTIYPLSFNTGGLKYE